MNPTMNLNQYKLTKLELTLNNQSLSISPEAYRNLPDVDLVNGVGFFEFGRDTILALSGLDQGKPYQARLTIRNRSLIESEKWVRGQMPETRPIEPQLPALETLKVSALTSP